METSKRHLHRLKVDFDLLDVGGVVHHPNYLVMCERARGALLDEAGYPWHELWKEGVAIALTESRSEYFRPARGGDPLRVETEVLGSSGVRLSLRQEIFHDQTQALLYRVELTLVCVSLQSFKPLRVPGRLAQALGV